MFRPYGRKKIGVAHNKSKTKAGQIGMKTGEFPPWRRARLASTRQHRNKNAAGQQGDDDELLVRASAVLKSQGPENWPRGRPGGRPARGAGWRAQREGVSIAILRWWSLPGGADGRLAWRLPGCAVFGLVCVKNDWPNRERAPRAAQPRTQRLFRNNFFLWNNLWGKLRNRA